MQSRFFISPQLWRRTVLVIAVANRTRFAHRRYEQHCFGARHTGITGF